MVNDLKQLHAIIPQKMRCELITYYHCIKNSHLGTKKTTLSLQNDKIYFPALRNEVENLIRNCAICADIKKPKHNIKAPLCPLPVGFINQRVHLDLTGPFEITPRLNKYLLLMIDSFSQYVEIVALPNIEAVTVGQAFFTHWVTRHGVPLSLLSDRGTNFEAKVFPELCKILNIHKIRTTSYYPACDGRIERIIGTAKSLVTCIMTTSDICWDEAIYYVNLSYNTTVHASTKFTPAYLMYGRELNFPLDLIIGIPVEEQEFTPTTYAQQLHAKLLEVYEIVRKNIGIAQNRQKQYFDEKSYTLQLMI